MNNLVFAKSVSFTPNYYDRDKGFGFARAADGREYYFQMGTCRKIRAGICEPEFSEEPSRAWPEKGEEIVLLPYEKPFCASMKPAAYRWGYARYYRRVEDEIKARPLYRIVGENRFKGQMMPNGSRETVVVECATLEEILAQFPEVRGSYGDRLGPIYRSGPCERLNRWLIWQEADWVSCDDPRPEVTVSDGVNLSGESRVMIMLDDELDRSVAAAGSKNRGKKEKPYRAVAA